MTAAQFAPAKVNLFLHVGQPGDDGYHPLVSFMVFADLGDTLYFEPSRGQDLTVTGPFGPRLSAGEDNLVLRAARALLAAAGRADAGFHLTLDKQLPLAAGLGGGSADAGAALRLLDRCLGLDLGEPALLAIAAGLGADGAACLHGRPVIAQGRGERLSAPPVWPDMPCVLVNPGALSSTGAVYRAYDAPGRWPALAAPPLPPLDRIEDVVAALADLRNDLEAPAVAMQPAIAEVLAALEGRQEVLFSRMSGSGATCFGLCADLDQARAAAAALSARPGWWARACTLQGA